MAWPAPPAAQGSVGEFSRPFQAPQCGNAHPGPAGWRAILSAMAILLATFHSGYAISIYIAGCAAVGLSSAAFMPDYTGKDISMEYDD